MSYPNYGWNPEDESDPIDLPDGEMPEDELPDISDEQF